MSESPKKESWHLDKRVPISIIAVVIGQLIVGIWWTAKLDERVTSNREDIERIEANSSGVPERLARIETLLESVVQRMDRREE